MKQAAGEISMKEEVKQLRREWTNIGGKNNTVTKVQAKIAMTEEDMRGEGTKNTEEEMREVHLHQKNQSIVQPTEDTE